MYRRTSGTFDSLTEKAAYPFCQWKSLFFSVLRAICFHPFRTALLYFLDDLLQGIVLGKREKRVYMIVHSTDHECRTFPLLEDARLIGEQAIPDVIGQPRLAMFRAVDEMDQVLDQ